MKKKKEIDPDFKFVEDEEKECERCGAKGTRTFAWDHFTEDSLCYQCTLDDVFDQMNERDN